MKSVADTWSLGDGSVNTERYSPSLAGTLLVNDGTAVHDVAELVARYGSPLEIFIPDTLSTRVRAVRDAFDAEIRAAGYRGSFAYHYPMKVNQRKEFVMTAVRAGANLETSSRNELALLKRAFDDGTLPNSVRVLCNGPKTEAYLALALEMHREGRSVTPIIESEEELRALETYDGPVGVRADMKLKISSHWDKKHNRFGLPEDQLLSLPAIPNLTIVSYHISSQIESLDEVVKPVEHIVQVYAALHKRNPGLTTVNIGGGAGIPYKKKPLYSIEELAAGVVHACASAAKANAVEQPNIICEWGRFMAAPAQLTVFKIIGAKRIVDAPAKAWYIIDGSFITDLPDTWSIHQRWHFVPVNGLGSAGQTPVWFAGSSCDSDDEYVPDEGAIMMPPLSDSALYVAALDTGAYQDSLSSRHCLLSHPRRIALAGGHVSEHDAPDTPVSIGALFGW
ncbi:hypothetical protein KGQ55_00675 [Patescibacteria group bacterium]|nr:hypothetical protein [Patescibacteria group bacterium]